MDWMHCKSINVNDGSAHNECYVIYSCALYHDQMFLQPPGRIRSPHTINLSQHEEKLSILTSHFSSRLFSASSYLCSHPGCSIYGWKDRIKGRCTPSHFRWPNFCADGEALNLSMWWKRLSFSCLILYGFKAPAYEI